MSHKNPKTREGKLKELIKRGIYKRETVFGNELQNIPLYTLEVNNNNDTHLSLPKEDELPEIVVRCIKKIDQMIDTTGLYRVNGDMAVVQKIR